MRIKDYKDYKWNKKNIYKLEVSNDYILRTLGSISDYIMENGKCLNDLLITLIKLLFSTCSILFSNDPLKNFVRSDNVLIVYMYSPFFLNLETV